MSTTLILCFESRIVQAALKALLTGTASDIEIVGEAASLEELGELCAHKPADVILVEEWLSSASLTTTARAILGDHPEANLLALSLRTSGTPIAEALRCGVRGCLDAESDPAELPLAIRILKEGKVYLSPGSAGRMADSVARPSAALGLSGLTEREREVMRLIAEGLSTREVARRLGISPRTAESHRASLMAKLGLHKVPDLVKLAIREGLVRL